MNDYNHWDDGLHDIEYLRGVDTSYTKIVQRKKVVGCFGIREGNYDNLIYWTVSSREDRRHGFVGVPTPHSEYHKQILETMFKRW